MNPKLSRLSAILGGLQKMLVTLIKKLGQHFYIFFFWLLLDNAARPFASCVEEEFWAEIMPQKSEKKVEEHKAPSEFRSDA